MLVRGRQPVGRSRSVVSARRRRAIVYALAILSVVAAAQIAVRLARPPDPYARVHVERLPGASSETGEPKTEVTYDAEAQRNIITVQGSDGTLRRYFVDDSGGQWRLEPAPQTPPPASNP